MKNIKQYTSLELKKLMRQAEPAEGHNIKYDKVTEQVILAFTAPGEGVFYLLPGNLVATSVKSVEKYLNTIPQ